VTADYVHCVGRTARRGRAGRVSCLVESREQVGRYRHLHALQPAQRLTFDGVS
jgi:superfamily II DNA/RNA helicase